MTAREDCCIIPRITRVRILTGAYKVFCFSCCPIRVRSALPVRSHTNIRADIFTVFIDLFCDFSKSFNGIHVLCSTAEAEHMGISALYAEKVNSVRIILINLDHYHRAAVMVKVVN